MTGRPRSPCSRCGGPRTPKDSQAVAVEGIAYRVWFPVCQACRGCTHALSREPKDLCVRKMAGHPGACSTVDGRIWRPGSSRTWRAGVLL